MNAHRPITVLLATPATPAKPCSVVSPFVITLVLTLASCGAGATTPSGQSLSGSARPLPVSVQAVELVDGFAEQRSYTGQVVAPRAAEIGFEVAGKVIRVVVDAGSVVTEGQVLARVDSRRLTAQRAEIAARLAQAKASLAEMRAGPRKEVIRAARAEVEQLRQEVELAQLQLGRKRGLFAKEAASQEEVDIAATGLETVAARLDGAKSRLDELVTGTRPERIEAQQALVESLVAQRDRIELDIGDCELKAPFAGKVATRSVEVGTVVDVGQPVFRLVQTGQLEAWIGVPSTSELGAAPDHQGRDERVALTIAGHEYSLPVARSLPELDERTRTRTLVFELSADAVRKGVRPGEVARLAASHRVATPGYWLPLSALTESTRGLWSCYVLGAESVDDVRGGARVMRAEVELLHVTVDRAFVRGTLKPGDLVLSSGTQRVVPGQLVMPTAVTAK